jgi:phospho-N-acetylmuramoyl-pentapeptide-transferase
VYWVHTSTNLSFTRLSLPGWNLTAVGWILLAILVIISTSNAVNLTDGLDGLAAGSGTFCFGVLAIIGYWQFRHYSIYRIHAALDLGLVAVALVGACLGFLWWNAAPAKIIMGDTGALAIGTGLGALCLLMNLDLLLVVLGGLFVAETASVILQVLSFRIFGRRIFRIAPFHHHFEMLGWPETTVLIRFWIIAGLCAMLGLGIFYGDFLKIAKVV